MIILKSNFSQGRVAKSVAITLILIAFYLPANGQGEASADYATLTGKIHFSETTPTYQPKMAIWSDTLTTPLDVTFLPSSPKGSLVFQADVPSPASFILEIAGEAGAGRMLVSPERLQDTLHIHYPLTETIVFLHTNDHHFDINLMEELEEKITEIRNEYADVFLFDAGDVFVRHPHRWVVNDTLVKDVEWYGQRSMEMIESMNVLGYQAMTLGNHELDYVEHFTGQALEAADFPILSANMEITTDALPSPKSHIRFSTQTGRSINVLGLSVASGNKPGIRQKDIFETAGEFMYLREEAEVFVALTHIGLQNDVRLAEEFPLLDIIIGGHSHHLIEEAVLVNEVLVAQAGGNRHEVSDQHPVNLGKVIVTLENGRITHKSGYVIFVGE